MRAVKHPLTWTNLDGSSEKVQSAISWISSDPLAVTVTFAGGRSGAAATSWTFSRDLLAEAVLKSRHGRTVGAGDVQLTRRPRHLILAVTSPHGKAKLAVLLTPVRLFLEASFGRCAPGSLHEQKLVHAAISAAIADAISGAEEEG